MGSNLLGRATTLWGVDEAAAKRFEAFASSRGPRLHRLAALLTGGDWHAAEDLVQQCLADVFVHWRRVERADDPDAYVRRVLVNRSTKRRLREVSVPEVRETPRVDPGLREVDDRQLLDSFLADLPPRQRAVLVLRYGEDLAETEVARLLGISVGTVKSQSWKALAALRARHATSEERS